MMSLDFCILANIKKLKGFINAVKQLLNPVPGIFFDQINLVCLIFVKYIIDLSLTTLFHISFRKLIQQPAHLLHLYWLLAEIAILLTHLKKHALNIPIVILEVIH